MERRVKKSVSYFPFECSFFNDLKIRKLIRKQGSMAPLVYLCILCDIYSGDGYYLRNDKDLPFLIAETIGSDCSEEYVAKVIEACLSLDLLDENMYSSGVLTSRAIQSRYKEICQKSGRKNNVDEFSLLEEESGQRDYTADDAAQSGSSSNLEDKPKTSSLNEKLEVLTLNLEDKPKTSSLSNKEKEKKSKVNDTPISNEIAPSGENLKQRKRDFAQSLVPFVDKYGKDMIHAFYDYWSETNDGGHKMRWELAKNKGGTFSIAGRLATWYRNEKKFSRMSTEKGVSISDAIKTTGVMQSNIDYTKLLGN